MPGAALTRARTPQHSQPGDRASTRGMRAHVKTMQKSEVEMAKLLTRLPLVRYTRANPPTAQASTIQVPKSLSDKAAAQQPSQCFKSHTDKAAAQEPRQNSS